VGERQLRHAAPAAAQRHDALPAQLLQRGLPSPVGRAQAPPRRAGVVLQEGEERREGALVARQREALALVVDAHADRAALAVVGQREEDVLLPAVADEVAARRGEAQHAVSLLHPQGAPVEGAALQLGRRVRDDLAVLLAGEGGEVGRGGGRGPRLRSELPGERRGGRGGGRGGGAGQQRRVGAFGCAVGYHPTGESRPAPISSRRTDILRGDERDHGHHRHRHHHHHHHHGSTAAGSTRAGEPWHLKVKVTFTQ